MVEKSESGNLMSARSTTIKVVFWVQITVLLFVELYSDSIIGYVSTNCIVLMGENVAFHAHIMYPNIIKGAINITAPTI